MTSLSLSRQRALLRLEYEYEKAQMRRETEAMGIGRRVKRGECWFPVSVGRSYYNSLDRFVVEIARREDTDITHNFEYGRSVSFFTLDAAGAISYLPFAATVSYAEESKMVVCLPDEQALARLATSERLGVQLHFDETTYRLMFDALSRTEQAKEGRVAALRDAFAGSASLSFSPHRAVPSLPWLNASQQQAVADVLACRDAMVVHGPPGTGKTTTLVEAISEVLRREAQVLVCAQSNMAVDWIALQLARRGISVLRIGNPTRVTDEMLACTYERRFADHPDYPTLWQLRRTRRQLLSTPRKNRPANFHQKLSRLRERADEIETRIRLQLLTEARVVACTLAGSANPLLYGQHYHTLFIDEAAQALQAACWIALQKADRVVLAGDHCQLPPTVKCPEALRGGLGTTLMEELAARHSEAVRLLTVQYRMNETLMRFSSDYFYGGKLTAAPEVRHRSILDDMAAPLTWVDTSEIAEAADADGTAADGYHESFVGRTYGRINKAEAELTLHVLRNFVEQFGRQRLIDERTDFGIISPYRAQVQYLRRLIKTDDVLRPLRGQIAVNTVDSFQGQERDVVLISLVRDNQAGDIGFLRDLRRMNVAITRARMKLFILGAARTLCRHPFYRKLYESCQTLNQNA